MSPVRTLLLLGVFAALWLLWSGHFEPLPLIFGAVSCVLTVWLARRMEAVDHEGFPLNLVPRMLLYVPWLCVQIAKSNLAVARLILHPKLPIHPRLLTVQALQKSVIGQVVHANSITVTPGTISLDLRDDTIMVHVLDASDDTEAGLQVMNRKVDWLEGPG